MGQPRYTPCPERNLSILEKLQRGYGVKLRQKDTGKIFFLHHRYYGGVHGYKLLDATRKVIPSWGNRYIILNRTTLDDFLAHYTDMEIENESV